MTKKIAMLSCYFGQLPWYFDYFLYSCGYNPTVDFFVITDDRTIQRKIPDNVQILYETLENINDMATTALRMPVDITYGYKLCDFKPAYGLIFSKIINNYDFWGHCDIDIIFGDIRAFITSDLLEQHDLISVRHDWLSGCFLIYKNIEKVNTIFLQSKDYRKVFNNQQHYCFDETNFAHNEFTDGKCYKEIDTEIESMTHVVKKMEEEGRLSPFFDFFIIEGLPGKLKWNAGKMYYRNKYEVLFYHLIHFKNLPNNRINKDILRNCFSISPTRIYRDKTCLPNNDCPTL